MTKPLPSLALDMSQDGITLHQLAFDGHWHELSRVALNDPALRARLSNMRSVATKLEGRRFKTRIWLPPEQIVQSSMSLMGTDDRSRLPKARAEIAAKFGGKPADYLVQLGKRAEGGAFAVAAVRIRTLQEARTFAKSHGFRAQGYSTRASVEGFAQPPNFALPADKFKLVGLGLVAATAATLVLGGGYTFVKYDPLNLWETPPKVADFAPFQRPNPGIERANTPAASRTSPAAPTFPQFATISAQTVAATPPYLPPRQLTAVAQESILTPTAPSPEPAPTPLNLASAVPVNWPASIATLPAATTPDPLPNIGLFSLQDRMIALQQPTLDTPPPAPSGPMPAYQAQPRPRTVANMSFFLEPLPAKATRLSPEALAAFTTRTGLSVAQLSQMPAPLLLASSKLITAIPGLPPILPRLRSGRPIPPQVALPEVPSVVAVPPPPTTPTGPAPLFEVVSGKPDIIPPLRPAPPIEVVRVPFIVVAGAPEIRPALRPAPETLVEAAPADDAALETAAAEATQTEPAPVETAPAEAAAADADPILIPEAPPETDTNLANAVDAALLAAIPPAQPQLFALLEGQPALLPRLRSGAQIPALAQPALAPATAAANALRPQRRPQAIVELPAPIDPTISSAAPITSARPPHRNESFAANAARIIQITTSRPRATAPPVPTDPQSVNLPTSASVARSATIENAINLRKTNLLGVFGTADNRTALILLSNGRRIRVQQGQSFSGWTVVAISTDTVRLQKRNREEILRMPAE